MPASGEAAGLSKGGCVWGGEQPARVPWEAVADADQREEAVPGDAGMENNQNNEKETSHYTFFSGQWVKYIFQIQMLYWLYNILCHCHSEAQTPTIEKLASRLTFFHDART